MSELEKAPIASIPIEPLVTPALDVVMQASHPVYGCLYLALALHQRTHVVTDDRRFAAHLGLSDHVRLLGN